MVTLQQLILKLSEFWASRGCALQQPLDVEVGAGTMHPETFLRVLGPAHWSVAYVQPSRRPADGRFGENPNRLFKHHQFQVILKPAPDDVQDLVTGALRIAADEHEGDLPVIETASLHRRGRRVEHGGRQLRRYCDA